MSDERRERELNQRGEPWRARFDDLKEAYVLGALTEEERREFEGYLAEHPELQAEVDDLGATANLLALAPQEYDPPPELRRNLLDRIGGATDTPPRRVRLRELFGPGGLAAAAAVLAVIGLFVWNASLREENENLRGELQTRQTYELRGSGAARDVRGEIVGFGDGRGVLMAENLPSAPEGRIYEAWILRDGVPEPAGLFEPHDEGIAAMPIEGSLHDADAVAVTIEQYDGSPMPTSEPLLTATL